MRILIADDHTIVREGIKMLLTEAYPAADIVDVSDAAALLREVVKGKWDVVISDISMPPGDSGLEALQKIKIITPTTPVIILSMQAPEQYAVRAMKYGASGYLTKGAATLELVNAVNMVLSGRKYVSPEVAYVLADAFEHINHKQTIEKLSIQYFFECHEITMPWYDIITIPAVIRKLCGRTDHCAIIREDYHQYSNDLRGDLVRKSLIHRYNTAGHYARCKGDIGS